MTTEEREEGVDWTAKRLDFENVSLTSSIMNDIRQDLLRIQRALDECKETVPDQAELVESFQQAAADFDSGDTSKLLERYTELKMQYVSLEAENKFLESYLAPEERTQSGLVSELVSEKELDAMKHELVELELKFAEEVKNTESLISKFVSELEEFPQASMESAFNCVVECNKQIKSLEELSLDETLQGDNFITSLEEDEIEIRARELSKAVGSMELELLKIERSIASREMYYEQLKYLQSEHKKLELRNGITSFFSDWNVVDYDDGELTLGFKSPQLRSMGQLKTLTPQVRSTGQAKGLTPQIRSTGQAKGLTPQIRSTGQVRSLVSKTRGSQAARETKQQKVGDVPAGYKLRLKVNEKTLAVVDVELEPADVPIDDIVQELAFRRTMYSNEPSAKPHNDMEFLLRRISQRLRISLKMLGKSME